MFQSLAPAVMLLGCISGSEIASGLTVLGVIRPLGCRCWKIQHAGEGRELLVCNKEPEGRGSPEEVLVNKGLPCKTQGVRETGTSGIGKCATLFVRGDLVTASVARERNPADMPHICVLSGRHPQGDHCGPRVHRQTGK